MINGDESNLIEEVIGFCSQCGKGVTFREDFSIDYEDMLFCENCNKSINSQIKKGKEERK